MLTRMLAVGLACSITTPGTVRADAATNMGDDVVVIMEAANEATTAAITIDRWILAAGIGGLGPLT